MRESPLRHAGFRRFLVARALSGAASWVQTVTAGYLIFRETNSPLHVGALAAVAAAPNLVVGPLGGWFSDRVDRRRLALILSTAQVIPAVLLTALALDGAVATFEIFGLTFLSALCAGLKRPVLAEIVVELVPEDQYKRAMADSAAAYNVARMIGPAVGGALVALLGIGAAFALSALLALGVVLALLSIHTSPSAHAEQHASPGITGHAAAMWRALLLRTLLETALMFFVFVGPLEQMMPVVAADHGDGAQYIGLLLAAIAVGGLLGNPVVRRLQERGVSELRLLGIALMSAGTLMIVLAISSGLLLDVVIIVLIGATWEVIWVTESTGVHFRSPVGLSGQAMGILYMTCSAAVALGSILAGWLGHFVGLEWTLTIAGLALILVGPAPLLWASRHLPRPTAESEPSPAAVAPMPASGG